MTYPWPGSVGFGRCGEFVGWAAAGLVIAGTASFAIAAVMADFL